ncbi:MAG: DNA polymerase Y family protein [Deltaproteobacteria bacterium]|nr:DNA polymerase Y family protein [Deltaproteobacteria bacterium]
MRPESGDQSGTASSPGSGRRADRLACVDIDELPLQLLLQRMPEWAGGPAAVVDEDRPQGVILWVNELARESGVLPGQRYAAALGLARGLRAGVVPPAAVGAAVAELTAHLRRFTPNVEPSLDEPGIFWLDAAGLQHLHPTLTAWGDAVRQGLADAGFSASVAVGWSRFGAYAVARSHEGVVVLDTPGTERDVAGRVPLARLGVPPRVRERLDRLAVRTVGELAALPTAGLAKRYGVEAAELQRLARGELFAPLTPEPERPPASGRAVFDDFVEHDAHRLLFVVKRLLDDIVRVLVSRQAVIAGLRLTLVHDARAAADAGAAAPSEESSHRFVPAAPTLDTALLLDLVRLRLEAVDLGPGVVEVRLEAREVPANADQLRLFALAPRRDLDAALRAVKRVEAELGDGSAGVFRLRDGHLPKAQYAVEPLARLLAPRPPEKLARSRPLARRVLARPEALPGRPRELRNDGWQPRDPRQGPIVAVHGPYVVSGGWWHAEVHREYLFARTLRGDILWVFYDKRRRRWFLQGRVE